jgi:hypothetical protein
VEFLLREESCPVSADVWVSPDAQPSEQDAIEMNLFLADDAIVSDGATGPRVDDDWSLLGYDICDRAFLSGLTNCGYLVSERSSLVRVWAPKLNRWHLFDSLGDAAEFRRDCDLRVPEHAPFRVVAIVARPKPADPYENKE